MTDLSPQHTLTTANTPVCTCCGTVLGYVPFSGFQTKPAEQEGPYCSNDTHTHTQTVLTGTTDHSGIARKLYEAVEDRRVRPDFTQVSLRAGGLALVLHT